MTAPDSPENKSPEMNNVDIGKYKRIVQYFWDPEPRNDQEPDASIWCLGREYAGRHSPSVPEEDSSELNSQCHIHHVLPWLTDIQSLTHQRSRQMTTPRRLLRKMN